MATPSVEFSLELLESLMFGPRCIEYLDLSF